MLLPIHSSMSNVVAEAPAVCASHHRPKRGHDVRRPSQSDANELTFQLIKVGPRKSLANKSKSITASICHLRHPLLSALIPSFCRWRTDQVVGVRRRRAQPAGVPTPATTPPLSSPSRQQQQQSSTLAAPRVNGTWRRRPPLTALDLDKLGTTTAAAATKDDRV